MTTMPGDEFLKLGRKIVSLLPKDDLQDFLTVSRQVPEVRDRAEMEVLLKKVRYLFRDHPSLITEWNCVNSRELYVEPVDEAQREAYDNLKRKLGKYVSLVNDVKNQVPVRRVYKGFLEGVVRNAREANAAGRIYKDGIEALEGCPELMKRLVDVLELPEILGEDCESGYYLSAEDVEVLRRRRAAERAADEQAAAAGLMQLASYG